MIIGPTQTISDDFFPNIKIDVVDRKGKALSVGDKVRIFGCKADYGYIGYCYNRVVLYFEADGVSVKWDFEPSRVELFRDEYAVLKNGGTKVLLTIPQQDKIGEASQFLGDSGILHHLFGEAGKRGIVIGIGSINEAETALHSIGVGVAANKMQGTTAVKIAERDKPEFAAYWLTEYGLSCWVEHDCLFINNGDVSAAEAVLQKWGFSYEIGCVR